MEISQLIRNVSYTTQGYFFIYTCLVFGIIIVICKDNSFIMSHYIKIRLSTLKNQIVDKNNRKIYNLKIYLSKFVDFYFGIYVFY